MANSIEVTNLVKAYGSLRAVDGVDCEVRTGEVFSFLGPNGAGKTTTVEILEGLRRRTSGEVRVLECDPWTQLDRLRSRIGVIPQDFHFFPKLTPREAIRLYASLFNVKVDAHELLSRVELQDKADDHYDTLSGGQHQKMGVALALVNDPELLFLDEPTTGLDPISRRDLWTLLTDLASDRFLILTTHYLEEAERLANLIGVLHKGKLIGLGTLEQLRAAALGLQDQSPSHLGVIEVRFHHQHGDGSQGLAKGKGGG
jgi:ABC-2 type transport system ATP-binding protein